MSGKTTNFYSTIHFLFLLRFCPGSDGPRDAPPPTLAPPLNYDGEQLSGDDWHQVRTPPHPQLLSAISCVQFYKD